MNQAVAPTLTLSDNVEADGHLTFVAANSGWQNATTYVAFYNVRNCDCTGQPQNIDVNVVGAQSAGGVAQDAFDRADLFSKDTVNATAVADASVPIITDATVGTATFSLTLTFTKAMNTAVLPVLTFPGQNVTATLTPNTPASSWTSATTFLAVYNVKDANVLQGPLTVQSAGAVDQSGNLQATSQTFNEFRIDTQNPTVQTIGEGRPDATTLTLTMTFPENMKSTVQPVITFPGTDVSSRLTFNAGASGWQNATTYVAVYALAEGTVAINDIDVLVAGARDQADNLQIPATFADLLDLEGKVPQVVSVAKTAFNLATGVVTFRVVFSEPVTGVGKDDFQLSATGELAKFKINSVTGSKTTYLVKVFVGQGRGTVRLDVLDNGTIKGLLGNSLGGPNFGDGTFLNGEEVAVSRRTGLRR